MVAPDRPMIVAFTSRSVNLSWVHNIDSQHPPVLHYVIQVRVGEEGTWEKNEDEKEEVVTKSRGNSTAAHVTALQPYTVYSFRVVALTSQGTSAPSKESYYIMTLRELPDGKPIVTAAHNLSDTSIRVEWKAPDKGTIHGEFMGYKLTYRRNEYRNETPIVVNFRDSNTKGYTIRGLEIFTPYLITLQVVNPEGTGPETIVVVFTGEGVPSKPVNVTIVEISDTKLRLSWFQPERPNGVIVGYRLYYMHKNYTDVRTLRNPLSRMEFLLTDLEPYTAYKIWLKAFTAKYEGEPSDMLTVYTDVQGPSAPNIMNLTCQSHDSLFLQWERPHVYHHQIDYYYIYFTSDANKSTNEIKVETGNNRLDHMMFIPNLTTNSMYEVKVQGATKSLFERARVYKGLYSEPRKVQLSASCYVSALAPATRVAENVSAGMIAGAVCASFALLLALLALILWRKYFQATYYYLDDLPPAKNNVPPMNMADIYEQSEHSSVPVVDWMKTVASLHADGDIGFSKEYEAIQAATTRDFSADQSQISDNKSKNRYLNIVAYDHSRVSLRQLPGQKKSCDYINANFIDGYMKPRAYIGTQGPLPSTFADFWRMVWEQRVHIIVMITNLTERGRRKCDMYWPKEGAETYGFIQVKLSSETMMATYTIRTFSIRNLKVKKKHQSERTVHQYHYTNWPDHGVPEHPLPVLSFVRKSSNANPETAGPIIVHCSAGVGRTGTYIVLDAMLRQIRHSQDVNVFGFLKHIRHQRNYLVQTEEQYIFIHDALLEAIEGGETDICAPYLTRYLQNLQTADGNRGDKQPWQLLERQFKLATAFVPKDFQLISANKPCNQSKNRVHERRILPVEAYRVHISAKPGVEGSDYINATFLQGLHKLREFIVTQHPLQDTVSDFWQMVWDHNVQMVVLLSSVDDKDYECFWPLKDEVYDFEVFKVKLSEEVAHSAYVTRNFLIQSTQDDYELVCQLVHCCNWPQQCIPLSSVFDLVHAVLKWFSDNQNGPVVVIDRYGGTEAATFCCLTTLRKQLDTENHVDVYQYAKLYHMRRPGMWRSQDDYLFLYRAMESITGIGSPVDSVNNGHLAGHVAGSNSNGSSVANGSGASLTANGNGSRTSLVDGTMRPAEVTTPLA